LIPIAELAALLRDGLTAWRGVPLSEVLFNHRDAAILSLLVITGLTIGAAIVRAAFVRRPGRTQIGLPALMGWAPESPLSWLRHSAIVLALAGVPFFMVALTDPYIPFRQQEVSFPGRRIAILIDASASMVIPFRSARFNRSGPNQASFFTTVGAAETFATSFR
jgi:hypothetical protein